MRYLILLLILTSCRVSKNFHEVDAGQYYRSAQLKGHEIQRAIDELGIKTIINLRGGNRDDEWYQDERAVAEANGVKLIDIGMSAKRLPHREDLIKLLDSFETAERPLLVHCQGGADRTGEASAIYQMLYMGKSKEEALKMLTIKYLHLKKRMPAKRYFIDELWQGEDWARHEYDPCHSDYRYYDVNGPHCQGQEEILSAEDDT